MENLFRLFQKNPSFQPCAFHVIFLILCFSLAIDNLPTKDIWLRFRYGIYLIMHVWLSISDQSCYKVKILYFWVQLNALTTCVIVTNLFWSTIFQYIITNHASDHILIFSKFLKTYFIGTVTESWRYMILSLIPGWVNVTLCISHLIMSWFINYLSGWNILWVSNDLSGFIPDRVNK